MEVLIKQTQEFMLKLNARSTWRLEKRKEIKGEITARSRFRVSATGELHLLHNELCCVISSLAFVLCLHELRPLL